MWFIPIEDDLTGLARTHHIEALLEIGIVVTMCDNLFQRNTTLYHHGALVPGFKNFTTVNTFYKKALKNYQDSHLKRNAVATWHAWAKTYIDDKDWTKAISIYKKGLEQFPNEQAFKNNIKYCRHQMNGQ